MRVLLIVAVSVALPVAAHADALAVFDSAGAKLGPVVDIASGPEGAVKVPFRVADRVVTVAVDRKGFGIGMSSILYESSCSGQPYFPEGDVGYTASILPIGQTSIVGYPGATLYVRDPALPVKRVRIGVYRSPNGGCTGIESIPPTFVRATPIKPVVDLSTMFVPPFHLEGEAGLVQLSTE